ncbi:MAG: BMP family ABC transporter substrate-binding protein [Anaerolineae bacterium]|nr:BMP family ABC transporter substrate-binding protein [Anaerolineae bacterium]
MFRFRYVLILVLVVGLLPIAATSVAQDEEFVFGLVMVGPHDDRGWSQAHYEAGLYVEENIPGTKMIWVESINPADSPDRPLELVVEDLVDQGAKLIIANSDEYKNDVNAVAPLYPDVTFLHVSGDAVLTGDAPPNVTNIMGEMEYGKMMAGCAAALTTQTGKISYLGPLINDETRRLAASAYLGAKYCYENYRGMSGADLGFEVVWIGFWFNIPGFTLDPTEVVNDFFNGGADVVISGIDTTEAIVVAGQRSREGEAVWAIPYDFQGACDEAPEACLGVPYFNWGPAYVDLIQSILDGTFAPSWDWNAPDWSDLNNPDTTAVGFVKGAGLSEEASAQLDEFIAALAAGSQGEEGGLNLWVGPLNLQDGTAYLAEGEVATDEQIWYLPQLLEGMVGDSVPAGS